MSERKTFGAKLGRLVKLGAAKGKRVAVKVYQEVKVNSSDFSNELELQPRVFSPVAAWVSKHVVQPYKAV